MNWPDLMRRKHGFADPVPANVENDLTHHGVDDLHGHAKFTGDRQIKINAATYDAVPRGHRCAEDVIDSTVFLDLDHLPSRILFVGGGFISFEFANIAACAGGRPVIVDRRNRSLVGFDPDLIALLIDRGRAAGVDLRRSSRVSGVERAACGFRVTVDHSGSRECRDTDLVHGAGRVADLADLGLDAAGVVWGERGVRVVGHLQSITNPAVWAAGDSADTTGMPGDPCRGARGQGGGLQHDQGHRHHPGLHRHSHRGVHHPGADPGRLHEAEARESGFDLAVRYTDTRTWYSTYRVGETTAAAKILIDRSTDLVVGAHLLGPAYSELVNTLGLAIKVGLTTRQLKSATTAYPTVGSGLGSLL